MRDSTQRSEVVTKRSYESPELTRFGALKDLTLQQGPGPASDKGSNMMGFS